MIFQSAYKSGFISLLICCCWLMPLQPVNASIIEQTLPDGVVATAEFHQGSSESPAILLVHGFLQTRQSHTVARLYNTLVDDGYTVLSVTLSLGITHRKQSLACEAIHSDSMESDISEIDLWSRWLTKKTGRKVILIGHSMGSVHLVAYLNHYPHTHIQQAIFISLSYFGASPSAHETPLDEQRARRAMQKDRNKLDHYGLSYCKDYVTTPGNYLSYYDWQPQKVINAIHKIKIPITVILGGSDKRMSKSWADDLIRQHVKVIKIPGAGHFFDDEYEFNLHDTVESILSTP